MSMCHFVDQCFMLSLEQNVNVSFKIKWLILILKENSKLILEMSILSNINANSFWIDWNCK